CPQDESAAALVRGDVAESCVPGDYWQITRRRGWRRDGDQRNPPGGRLLGRRRRWRRLDCAYWLFNVEFSDEASAHVHLNILGRQIVGGAVAHIDDHANESTEEKVPEERAGQFLLEVGLPIWLPLLRERRGVILVA